LADMKRIAATLCFAAVFTCTFHAMQVEPPSARDTKKGNTKPLTLVGCVAPADSAGGQFTLLSEGALAYRLSGANMRDYVGRRVQVVGDPASRRLRIVGGLVPSANVAAQAGAIDPSQAAIAAAEAGSAEARHARIPEFRVKAVQTIPGSCPAK
jgi:hypothetical protein